MSLWIKLFLKILIESCLNFDYVTLIVNQFIESSSHELTNELIN